MIKLLTIPTAVAATLSIASAATLQDHLNDMEAANLTPVVEVVEEKKEEKVSPKIVWECKGCSENEKKVLDFFQKYGIEDRYALATLMGNIKQESNFHTNICEGGARVSYHRCYSGGFGLIQWTTYGRYHGLGHHATITRGNPDTLETQLSYLVTEREWKEAEWRFKTPGKSVGFYMKGAYRWLGWGIHGNRTHYTNQYVNWLTKLTPTP